MDTEKHLELEKKIATGKSPNDEGPYYHHTWWESYKGSVKGKLGGVVIGTLVGEVIGGVVIAAASVVGATLLTAAAIPTIGAFATAGMLYGAHEFSDIGKVTGAVAATQQQAEARMKSFEDVKFAEIKQEISELKSLVKGETADQAQAKKIRAIVSNFDDQDYRKTHYAKLSTPKINSLAFWKVALVGLAVGAVAGALLGATGLASELMDHIITRAGGATPVLELLANHPIKASALIFGAMGASFGMNRDVFRRIFDKTDLWFKGIVRGKSHDIVREHQTDAGVKISNGHHDNKGNGYEKASDAAEAEQAAVAKAVMPENTIDYPTSSTFHRDRVLASAEKALRSFDHTRATPQ
jgi:hypothetical protein